VLGYAYPLFFKFLHYVLMLVFLQICSYNIIELLNGMQYSRQYCEEVPGAKYEGPICSAFFVQLASLNPLVTGQEVALRLTSFVLQLFMLVYIRNKMIKTSDYYNERNLTIAKYTVIVKGLPSLQSTRSQMEQLFT
jgi:hypothetical protein